MPLHASIGGMYMYEAGQLITINTGDEYHAVSGFTVGSNLDGMTFLASSTGAITNTANNGGVLRCTDATHGLTTGQYVTLTGMGDGAHNGVTRVTVIDVNTFDCDDIAYNSISDTGVWDRGSSLTVEAGHGGIYSLTYSMSASSAGTNKVYKIELYKNATGLDEFVAERKIAIASDLGNMGSSGIATLTSGDVVWMAVENTTGADTTNMTLEHANVHAIRL